MRKAFQAGIATAALIAATAPALAADLPRVMPVKAPAIAPVFDWSGLYAGVNYGIGVGQSRGTSPAVQESYFDRVGTGFTAGAQAGWNWQFDPRWVAGVATDISWLGIDRTFQNWNHNEVFGVEADWLATLRGRLGYTSGPSLFYLTGGAALVKVTNFAYPNALAPVSASKVATGWTVGGGIETMLGGHWSASAEYLYVNAGSQSVVNPAILLGGPARYDNHFHVFRQSLNYRFGGNAIPPASLPAHQWSGFYAGLHAGSALSQTFARVDIIVQGAVDIADAALMGGLQAGINWQVHPNWVFGIEGDIGALGIDRTYQEWSNTNDFGVRADWYGTARARFGYSTGPALLYATGGAAIVHVKNTYDQSNPGTNARSEAAIGWVLGGGIEAALGSSWTAKAEYLFINAGDQNVPLVAATGNFDNRFHIFRFGLNHRFSSGAN